MILSANAGTPISAPSIKNQAPAPTPTAAYRLCQASQSHPAKSKFRNITTSSNGYPQTLRYRRTPCTLDTDTQHTLPHSHTPLFLSSAHPPVPGPVPVPVPVPESLPLTSLSLSQSQLSTPHNSPAQKPRPSPAGPRLVFLSSPPPPSLFMDPDTQLNLRTLHPEIHLSTVLNLMRCVQLGSFVSSHSSRTVSLDHRHHHTRHRNPQLTTTILFGSSLTHSHAHTHTHALTRSQLLASPLLLHTRTPH
ncbi:hypothetical protein CPAR01_05117 [Colletotrichum paranaense]|uniref:Uncharacterized protein n=1 Tax=Colletotrichum paranaense TaxID=1914294 RepID=A0ABQ9SQX7_9PEZI|nr:uncharacterized protein CPAR01_05117 [Colletotrichum paranaense]KAK1541730.1 hypothetical protein CPAR01_05117 [Colletotrichum paranaense]